MTPAPKRPLVLLLHDASDDPGVWAEFSRRCADPGRVATLDLRGPDNDATGTKLADALDRPTAEEVVLVAHGGRAAAAAMAARHAEDGGPGQRSLCRLVLLGASFPDDEAWSRRLGVLRTPALLVGATSDADFMASAVAPYFTHARVHYVERLATPFALGPLAADLASLIDDAAPASPPTPLPEPEIDPAYTALIASDRVTQRTREALQARAAMLPPSPAVLTPPLLAILRAAVDLILPVGDEDGARVDIGRRIDQVLAGGGDGWRHASLPPDAEAMTAGLRMFDHAARVAHGRPFLCLDTTQRQALLDGVESGALAGPVMALWFSDLRREAVRAWISHPAVLGRLGYSGIGSVGGDGPVKRGFTEVGPDSTEAWEPRAW